MEEDRRREKLGDVYLGSCKMQRDFLFRSQRLYGCAASRMSVGKDFFVLEAFGERKWGDISNVNKSKMQCIVIPHFSALSF